MARLPSPRFLIVVAAGYVAGIAAYSRLPAFHRPWIAFLLPTTAAVIYVLIRRVWERDLVRDRDETFEAGYEAIVFAVVAVRHCDSLHGSRSARRRVAGGAGVADASHDRPCRVADGQSG